jgi:hypothetical protein
MRFVRPTFILGTVCALVATGAAAQTWKPAQSPPPGRGTAPAPPPPAQPAPPPPQYPSYPYPPQVIVVDPGFAPGPELPNCVVTLSGALNGTYGCHFVQASLRANRTGALRISSNPGETILNRPTVEVDVGFPGAPAAGAVHGNADAAYGTMVWVRYNGATWAATAGGMGGQGAYTVRLSRAADAGAFGTGRAYSVAGTLDADLPAYGGAASGTLHLRVTF